MTELILKNAKLILANEVIEGSIKSVDGIITSVDPGPCNVQDAFDCEGDYLSPGFIELHTDNIERHLMPRPNSFWPADAAVLNHDRELASVGITTVFNAICVGDVIARSMRLENLQDLCDAVLRQTSEQNLKIDHYLHLRCEVSFGGLLELLEPLIGIERVKLISVMDHTPGQRQFVDIDTYSTYYQGKFGLNAAEMVSFMEARRSDQEKYSASNRRTTVELARRHNIAVASHDDATMDHIREAIEDKIVIAEFPTTLEAAKGSHDAGMAVLMGGPNIVRGKSHAGNISARDLAQEGLLDVISSDYVPSSLIHAAIILQDVIETISLPQAIAKITHIPARAIGFDDRGELREGLRADMVRFKSSKSIPIVEDVWSFGKKVA